MTDPQFSTPRPRLLPGCGAWLIGAPIGLALGAVLISGWLAAHPQPAIEIMRRLWPDAMSRVLIEGATFEPGEGWTAPRSWRWHIDHLTVLGTKPQHPTFLVDDLEVAVPEVTWGGDGWVLTVRAAEARRVDMAVGKITERVQPPEPRPSGFTLVVHALVVEHFALSMERGLNPEVLVDADNVRLATPFVARPLAHELTGSLALDVATVSVAGVRVDDVHPSTLRLEDHGLQVVATGKLADALVDITFDVKPLIGRARIDASASLRRASLTGLGLALLESDSVRFLGSVEAKVTLSAGGDLGPGNLRGKAKVDVTGAGFVRPESKRAAVALAVALAPFLRFDDEGNVVVGDFHGDLSFTQRGINFDTITYEAPHSTGELKGYVHGTAVSAKLHFLPLPHSGAIEWGLVLRGDIRKPKIALALPAVLRAWTPCEDADDCPLVGGAPRGEVESEERMAAELAKAARAAAREQHAAERAARRAEHAEARAAQREEKASERDAGAGSPPARD